MPCVFVVNHQRQPLDPVHPGRARFLLKAGHAAVLRRYPFTLIMKDEKQNIEPEPLRVKIDPGSKTTGLALIHDHTGQVVWASELSHRSQQVQENLAARRMHRRFRRQRHTRYRTPRFSNRTRRKGWLPPSLESRIQNILTWVDRLRTFAAIAAISQELVTFETQVLQNPDISGIQYQQGTLQGYEIREYLLEKWGRKCAYCQIRGMPLEIEHVIPKRRGGSNRPSNLALACEPCNKAKDNQTAEEFGPPHVMKEAKQPFKDAAAGNATRWELYRRLQALGLPVEVGTGGKTQYNRSVRKLPKTHWLDAACVGASTPDELDWQHIVPLLITAHGRHSRQMQRTNTYGFPEKAPKATSVVGGLRTGDMVRAVVPKGKKAKTYTGRIAIRATGSCNIKTQQGTIQGIHYRYGKPLHRGGGYSYEKGACASSR
jgi:5-methylcytosine-specific restriction endonuclease McrA